MAYSDYYLCDLCESKAFYDSNLHYDFDERVDYGCGSKLGYVGDMKVLCETCAADNIVAIVRKPA